MAQADGVVANGTGSAVRSDINNQYAALWSNHSGSTEPSSGKVAFQTWADTNSGYLKIRNAANNAWIQLFKLDGTDLANICRLTGSTNNQITTVTGANAIQGEANLTFDGTDLATTGRIFGGGGDYTHASAGHDDLVLKTTGATGMTIVSGDTSNGTIAFADGTTGNSFYRGYFQYNHNTDLMSVGVGGGTMMEWTNANVKINDGNLVIGTAGHGIDFSATSGTGSSELLDDYEEGTHTTTQVGSGGGVPLSNNVCYYTKIGNICHVHGQIDVGASSGSSSVEFSLPFTSKADGSNRTRSTFALMHKHCDVNNSYKNIVGYVGQNEAYWRIYNVGDDNDWHQFLSGDFTANSAEINYSLTYQTA